MPDRVNTIVITKKEYESLLEDADKLACLESCGVDNWCGWDDAMEMFHEIGEEKD